MNGSFTKIANPRQAFGRRTAPPRSADYFASTPSPTAQPAAARAFDAKAVIGRSFWLMGQNAVTYLALVAAAAAPERIAYHVLGDSPVFMLLEFAITALTCIPLYGAVFIGAMLALAGQKANFKTCFRAGMSQSRPAALLSLMTALFVWLLLILPALGFAIRCAVAAPIAIVEGLGLRAAMARSAALTAPHRQQVRGLILLLGAAAVVRALPMLALWHIPTEAIVFFMFGNWLFPLLLTAFTAAASASLYYELRPAKKPEPESELPPIVA